MHNIYFELPAFGNVILLAPVGPVSFCPEHNPAWTWAYFSTFSQLLSRSFVPRPSLSMVLLMALIVVVLAWAVGSIIEVGGVSCSPQNISLTINDEDGVLDLASALDCSDGTFTVTWVGSLAIPQTLTVTDGTSLTIIGEDAGSALDGRGVTGPLIFVDGSSSALTLRNLGVKRGSGFYGGAISALTSAAVNIVNCTFSENDASQSGGETQT